MAKSVPQPKKPDGPWLLLKYLIPLFAIVFIVNGFMVYKAQTTFNGLTTERAYEKGLAYNQTLAQQEAQAKLGWSFVSHEEGRTLTLTATGADKAPLVGLNLTAQLVRPTNTGEDKTITFTETAPGTYTTTLENLEQGQWDVNLTATKTQPGMQPDTFVMQFRTILR